MSKKKYNYVRRGMRYDGKEYEAYGRTEAEALKKLAAIRVRLERGEGAINAKMTVSAWADTWLDTYIKPRVREPGQPKRKGTMTQKSYAMYTQKLDGYVLPAIGKMKLAAVKDTHLQQILNGQAGRSKSHVSKLKIVIQAMFAQAAASRVIPYDPSTKLFLPVVTEGSRRSLTDAEYDVLMKTARTHRCGLWVRTLHGTGIRPGESAPLLVMDFDLVNGLLSISKSLESGAYAVGDPKTASGIREVPIPEDLIPDLRTAFADKSPFDLAFPQTDGHTMMTETCIQNNWRSFSRQMDLAMGAETTAHGHIYDPRDLKADGTPMYPDPKDRTKPRNGHKLAPDLDLYCLRHTYCTDLKAAGVPVDWAKDLMGHADITTTANIYADVNISIISRAADMINRHRKAIADGKSDGKNLIKTG